MQMPRCILDIYLKLFNQIFGQDSKITLVTSVYSFVLMILMALQLCSKLKKWVFLQKNLLKIFKKIMKRLINFMILTLQIITQLTQMKIRNTQSLSIQKQKIMVSLQEILLINYLMKVNQCSCLIGLLKGHVQSVALKINMVTTVVYVVLHTMLVK